MFAIFAVIPVGMWIGAQGAPQTFSGVPRKVVQLTSGLMTALILFLMSVTLQSGRLWAACRRPAPVLWGALVNAGFVPLAGLCLLPLQGRADYRLGFMVAACVPCTLAASSVWTRKAGGNDAISLLVTVLTNGLCFLITPIGLGDSVQLNTMEMIGQLFLTALVPILIGQGSRLWPRFRQFADRSQAGFGLAAQICILAIVFWASLQSGARMIANFGDTNGGLFSGLVVWGSCVGLHLAALVLTLLLGPVFGFSREDTIGSAFAGSQKTLPIGLFIIASIGGSAPLAALPMFMYHASQLILDSLLLDSLHRWANVAKRSRAERHWRI